MSKSKSKSYNDNNPAATADAIVKMAKMYHKKTRVPSVENVNVPDRALVRSIISTGGAVNGFGMHASLAHDWMVISGVLATGLKNELKTISETSHVHIFRRNITSEGYYTLLGVEKYESNEVFKLAHFDNIPSYLMAKKEYFAANVNDDVVWVLPNPYHPYVYLTHGDEVFIQSVAGDIGFIHISEMIKEGKRIIARVNIGDHQTKERLDAIGMVPIGAKDTVLLYGCLTVYDRMVSQRDVQYQEHIKRVVERFVKTI